MPQAWHAWLLASIAVMAGLVALIETGRLQVPMPHPAERHYFQAWPEESPWRGSLPHMPPFSLPLQQLAVRLLDGQLPNVETVAGDARGRLLLPDKHGAVHVAEPLPGSTDGSYALQRQPLAQLGPGRVLGTKLDAQGNLVMCDVLRGLLRLNTTSGVVEVLSSRVTDDGSPIFYCNGLDVAANGSVLFTASTDILPARSMDGGSYDTGGAWALNLFRGIASGRLLVWHPHTRTTHVLAEGLRYPDGVLVAAEWSHVLVVETDALQVSKLRLTGERAGEREVLIRSLPGLPAGLARASDGNLWLSLTAPVPPYTRFLWPICLRAAIAWMPRSWRPPVKVWGAVLKVSPDSGRVLQVLLDPTGERVATASAATETGGRRLFLGNLMAGSYISVVNLQQLAGVEQQLQQQAAVASTSNRGINWSAVGGSSLHEQRELWVAK